jgi:hypothetical protein
MRNEIRQDVLRRTNRLRSFDTARAAQKTTLPIILCCRWRVFTELLPCSDKRIQRERERERERERKWKGGDSERDYNSGGGSETIFSV